MVSITMLSILEVIIFLFLGATQVSSGCGLVGSIEVRIVEAIATRLPALKTSILPVLKTMRRNILYATLTVETSTISPLNSEEVNRLRTKAVFYEQERELALRTRH